jgi:hypothetical protein
LSRASQGSYAPLASINGVPIRPQAALLVVLALGACARDRRVDGTGRDPGAFTGPVIDGSSPIDQGADGSSTPSDLAGDAGGAITDGGSGSDGGAVLDAGPGDAASATDAVSAGIISGGSCSSGAAGATAYRVRWAGNGSGSTAYPVYEVNGLPDRSRDHVGAYTYQVGGSASWDDPFLGAGGLVLDSSDFVDIELSTSGVTHVRSATLAILGRSFATTSAGSFSWQTGSGTGATPTNAVSNSAPYAWYAGDATAVIPAGDAGLLLRIKAGPSSGSLIVNRIELCMDAD